MTSAGSVAPDERMRLFLALRLPDDALDEIVAWQAPAFAGADVRIVPREHLHATLAFLGSRPADELPECPIDMDITLAAPALFDIEFEVRITDRHPAQLINRAFREGRPAEIRVQNDTGCIDDPAERRFERLAKAARHFSRVV